ncbi:MAG: oxygen-dependent coproporphyrinogen oxidase [Pacificimonas sp.]
MNKAISASKRDFATRQKRASGWFATLRDRICAEIERLEDQADHMPGEAGRFTYTSWKREDPTTSDAGGGTMGLMKGRLFEKVGVNISSVHGAFSPEFAKTIPGAEVDPSFRATGISLVAHMANPHVPAVHMNTRYLATTRDWFGGGADLNPPLPRDEDTAEWKAALAAACDRHEVADGARYAAWCDDYFDIPHRGRGRGVGGIFYDRLRSGDDDASWDADLAFTKDVGETFLAAFPPIVRRRMGETWTDEDRAALLAYRGLYAEFNLVYDRGTLFGLKTGGNIDAILTSLPPVATWD